MDESSRDDQEVASQADLDEIWKKEPKERSKADVKKLASVFASNKFFVDA